MRREIPADALVIDRYDPEHGCITVAELRWLLRSCGRHTPYYTYFLLRTTKGPRGDETATLCLPNLNRKLTQIEYTVQKYRNRPDPRTGIHKVEHKHRTIYLDPWVREELIAYMDLHFGVIEQEGQRIYVSPWNDPVQGLTQMLFPWKAKRTPQGTRSAMPTIDAYWGKLRHKMQRAGFDAFRLESERRRTMHDKRRINDKTYVLRPHILRHFCASVLYYRYGKDIKRVQKELKHSDPKTTSIYIHPAHELGSTEEELRTKSWAELLGFEEGQETLSGVLAPSQRIITMY